MMMTGKEQLRNDILVAMAVYMDACMVRVLEAVLVEKLQKVEMVRVEALPATEMSDNEYIIKLFLAQKAPRLSRRTVEQYMYSVKGLLQAVDKSLLHMTDMDIEYYLRQHARKGNSNVSVNNMRKNLSAVYVWMRRSHLTAENPVEGVEPMQETDKPVEHLEGHGMEELREGCRRLRDRALLEFLRSTGVRIGEVPGIILNDIDWNEGSLLLFAPKTRRYRTVFLDDVARYHLRKYVDSRGDGCDALFASLKKPFHPLRESGLRSVIKKIAGNTGMKQRIYPHLMRKTFATDLNEKGCPLPVIQDLMGHSYGSAVTKKRYIATSPRQLAQAHRMYR